MKPLITGGIAIVFLALCWYGLALRPVGQQESAVQFSIAPGSRGVTIANELHAVGLIRSPLAFRIFAKVSGRGAQLQAGDYVIASNSSVKQIVTQLSGGNVIDRTVTVTIVPGLRIDKMLPVLQAAGLDISETDWTAATGPASAVQLDSVLTNGKPTDSGLEGYLFADTYEFFTDATALDVVERMVATGEQKILVAFPDIAAQAAVQDLTVYEALTLASVVEREVTAMLDRKIVAGIFLQRLADQYPLQSDATVEYVTRANRVETSVAETEIESPWNTYRVIGLPRTPIASPSLDALGAVLDPTPSDYYFFLTTDTGEVIYATDFEQHLVNKEKYL